MWIYIMIYFIVTYITNSVFVFLFTSLLGKVESENIFQFVASSFPYVLPFTIINLVIVGIASCYLIKAVLEKGRLIALLPLILTASLDVLIAIDFFNNRDLSIILIRIALVSTSYVTLFFGIKIIRFYDQLYDKK